MLPLIKMLSDISRTIFYFFYFTLIYIILSYPLLFYLITFCSILFYFVLFKIFFLFDGQNVKFFFYKSAKNFFAINSFFSFVSHFNNL